MTSKGAEVSSKVSATPRASSYRPCSTSARARRTRANGREREIADVAEDLESGAVVALGCRRIVCDLLQPPAAEDGDAFVLSQPELLENRLRLPHVGARIGEATEERFVRGEEQESDRLEPPVALRFAQDILAGSQPVRSGRRPVEHREQRVGGAPHLQMASAGPAGVLGDPLGGLVRSRHPAAHPLDVHQNLPGPGEPEVVSELLEDRDRLLRFPGSGLVVGALGSREHSKAVAEDDRVPLDSPVAGGARQLDRPGEHGLGPTVLAGVHERPAQVGEELEPRGVVIREEGRRPLEEVDRGGRVAAAVGSSAGRREVGARLPRERPGLLVEEAEGGPRPERLLEVVADDLLDFCEPAGSLFLEPAGDQLVQGGAELLRERPVAGVLDEDVAELEGSFAGVGRLRSDELLAYERFQPPVEHAGLLLGQELEEEVAGELLADRGRALEHDAFARLEALEAHGEEGLDRGRQLEIARGGPALGEHGDGLLEEEGIALRDPGDPCARLGGKPGFVGEAGEELVGLALGERLEPDRGRVRLPAGPGRTIVEELGAGEAEEEDRRVDG